MEGPQGKGMRRSTDETVGRNPAEGKLQRGGADQSEAERRDARARQVRAGGDDARRGAQESRGARAIVGATPSENARRYSSTREGAALRGVRPNHPQPEYPEVDFETTESRGRQATFTVRVSSVVPLTTRRARHEVRPGVPVEDAFDIPGRRGGGPASRRSRPRQSSVVSRENVTAMSGEHQRPTEGAVRSLFSTLR